MKRTLILLVLLIGNTMAQNKDFIGEKFPVIKGESLAGKEIKIPDDIEGKPAVLILAFERKTQEKIDGWTKAVIGRYGDNDSVDYFEIPMIGGWFAKAMSGIIDAGMRGGVPKNLHDNVVTYYGDLDNYFEELNIKDESDCYLFLIDKNGIVRYRTNGEADEQKIEQLFLNIDHLKK